MIKDAEYYQEFERQLAAADRLTYDQAVAIIEGLREEAIALGIWPQQDPMEGIDIDIRVARTLNACTKSLSPR
jgi:hypothetical protein